MPDQPKKSSFLKACNMVIAAGMLNFLIFVAGAIYLGGDAVNGKVEEGRYFLFGASTESGRKVYTEVTEPVFTYKQVACLQYFCDMASGDGSRLCTIQKAIERKVTPSPPCSSRATTAHSYCNPHFTH